MGQDNAGESDRTPFAENPHYVVLLVLIIMETLLFKTCQPNKVYKANDILSKSTVATVLDLNDMVLVNCKIW